MSKFESKILVDCLDSLIDYRGKTPKKSENGIPTLSAKSVKMGEIFYDRAFYISPETYNKFMVRGIPKKGDVLLTTEAPLGCVARLDRDDVGLAQRLITLRGKNNILDNGYLMYYLMSPIGQYELKNRATGTTVQGIKRSELEKVLIKLPPLPEQKAIAHILGTLDDKIELNRQMNQTLEAMAQALFKSWFVDFDPVIDNAIQAGNKIPEELLARAEKRRVIAQHSVIAPARRGGSDEGVRQAHHSASKRLIDTNPALAALFPSSFVFNETLGKWIPEGWEVKSVEDALIVNPSVSIKKGEKKKFADMKGLPTSGFSIEGFIEKEYNGGAKFNKGDVLLARITPCLENGKTAIVDFLNDGENGFGSTEFIVLRGKNSIKTPFVACLARHDLFVNHCIQNMVGSSGRQRVQNSCFNSFFLALPDIEILKKFDDMTNPSFQKITKNSNETETLVQLRDRLLPELISGRVRVPNVTRSNF